MTAYGHPDTQQTEAKIYCLVDPETNRIRYVGSALNSVLRLRSHIRDCKKGGGAAAQEWLRYLHEKGCSPGVRVLETVSVRQRFEAEKRWIDQMRRNGEKLLNVQHCPRPQSVIAKPFLDEWMSVTDAAALKGVAASSVRDAINSERLKGKKIGRNYVVLRRDVEAWVIGPRGPKKKREAGTEAPE